MTLARTRVVAEGHLIDSRLMSKILDLIVEHGGSYEVQSFDIGRTMADVSRAEVSLSAQDPETLERILENLVSLGCQLVEDQEEVSFSPSAKDGTAPDGFYSTTNHRTRVFHGGEWVTVEAQRMDAVIVKSANAISCVKLRDVVAGDLIACGIKGIQVFPPTRTKEKVDFGFMNNDVSSERRVELAVAQLATLMRDLKARKGRVVAVVGPVVVHTGGAAHLGQILRGGFIQGLLTGNALGVHDVEAALQGTSLGVNLTTGIPAYEGHANHMRAINAIRRCGSLREAVAQGVLRSGIMYEAIQANIDLVLAGSIRDDGPLPETIMDMVLAQERYAEVLQGAELVLILSTMLHGIGTGNMTPSWVRTICVDINPAVVTKLVDRGSSQASGLVTDVGLFVRLLADELAK